MKICIVGDVHFSQYSSILRQRGKTFSIRLENLISSINWAEDMPKKLADKVIYLGDFFDRPDLNSEEITALNNIKWNNLPHSLIVGNHESDIASLIYNSTRVFSQYNNFDIIYNNKLEKCDTKQLLFLPYALEENRIPLSKLTQGIDAKNIIAFSHNDIKGIQYGGYLSKEGYDLKDIESSCGLFINGHLHNGSFLNDKQTILNLGNLTGQNFSEDASKYDHRIAILDTDTMKISFYVNPFAFNFYKLDIDKENDLSNLIKLGETSINHVNMVLSIKCEENLVDKVKSYILSNKNIIDYRLVIYRADSSVVLSGAKFNSVDHLKQFSTFVLNNIGTNEIVEEELTKICGASK
jgi:hypothetical protein